MANPVLYSLELERQFLSGTILHPDTRAETAQRIQPADLSQNHQTILGAIDAIISSGETLNEYVLIDRLNSLGLKIADAIDPAHYVMGLKGLAVAESAVDGIARQLKTWSIRREVYRSGVKIAELTAKDTGLKASEIVGKATEIFNGKVNLLSGTGDDEPEDLFGDIEDDLDRENAYGKNAIALPLKTLTDMFGALDIGVSVIVSRMKVGKSTLALDCSRRMAMEDKDDSLRILILDTELKKEENRFRALSAISGVKEYHIRHKVYLKNPEMRKKVEAAAKTLSPLRGRVVHKYVGGMDTNQITSIARRWAHKTLRTGKRGFIIYDYLKINDSQSFASKAGLHVLLGAQMDAFKNLSKELSIPILAFCQANRSGEDTKEGGRIENSSVVGGSDMITQFASNVWLLSRLSPEERMKLCPDQSVQFTHTLKAIATRILGPDNMGKNRLVRYKDEKGKDRWCENFLLLNFTSFSVTECEQAPTLLDLMERTRMKDIPVQPVVGNDGERQLL